MSRYYARVAERAAHRCEYCRAPEIVFNMAFEVDHIVPRSRGGSNALDNLALACSICNLFKSDFESGIDQEALASIELFNPRRDEWTDHFRVEYDTAEIVGITPIGRATTSR